MASGRQQVERQLRLAGQRQDGGIGAVGRREAQDFAAGIDESGARKLAQPEQVRGEDAGPEREHDRRRSDGDRAHQRRDARLGEVGILAEANRRRAQREDAHRGGHRVASGCGEPAQVHRQRQQRDDQPADGERPGVAIDQPAGRGPSSCHRPRVERLAERAEEVAGRRLPRPSPGCRRARSRRPRRRPARPTPAACAGVEIPNPTATGSGVAARTWAIDSARPSARAAVAPVTPRRATR